MTEATTTLTRAAALLAECDEEWMTGKIYLNLKDGDFHPDGIAWKFLQKKCCAARR